MSAGLSRVVSAAAVLLEDAVDTDVIFPARFLLRMDKQGLGDCLFADRGVQDRLRGDDGVPLQILLAGAQFGCGSSREHAVWSLVDFGIRVVIAPSFGEIFANNAARGGLAAIRLPRPQVEALARVNGALTVDLETKRIMTAAGDGTVFEMDEGDWQALINGWDEIDMIDTAHGQDISDFESAYLARRPWLAG
jgi:3-isopropylmalate dehydratase small subunit